LLTGGDARAALRTGFEQVAAARVEALVEVGDERHRVVGQDFGGAAFGRSRQRERHGDLLWIDACTSSMGCSTRSGRPMARAAAAICSAHPGLAATTVSAPVARRLRALRSPSSSAGSGLSRL